MAYKDQLKQAEYQRRWSKKRKEDNRKLLAERLAKGCQDCGNTHPAVLEWHHMEPEDKAFDMSKALGSRSPDKILMESEKCIVLCRNCHAIRHYHASVA